MTGPAIPSLTMADIPEIKVVLINNPEVGSLRRRFGSRECTGCAGDCRRRFTTQPGRSMRRLPMKPAYVQATLKT